MSQFDRRIVRPTTLAFLQACGHVVPYHLGGGAALAGLHLRHRLSNDVDLFVHDREAHRELVAALPAVGEAHDIRVVVLRDGGSFVRAALHDPASPVELDLIFEPVADVEPPAAPVEGVIVESLADLRANKLTCLLSRSEPRDLVDLLFLDRAGYAPEADLPLALRKDTGIDPGMLAWLLGDFPIEPMPVMLQPLQPQELRAFRDDLRERLRRVALPPEEGAPHP